MWLRYARQAQNVVPVWGVSQVALKLDDTESMAQILDRNDKALPIYNKYDTAYALGDVQQALDTAFQGMSQPFGDEPLYDRFRQHAPLNANYVQLLASKENSGALDRQGLQFEGRLVLQPTLHAVLAWSRRQQSSSDANLASLTNDVDQLDSVSARWLGERGQTHLTLFRRTGGQSTLGLRATQSLQVGRRLSLEAGINYRDDSSISQPMSVAGYQDRLFGNLTYVLGKREYFRVSPEFNRYFTQQGDYLGGGSPSRLRRATACARSTRTGPFAPIGRDKISMPMAISVLQRWHNSPLGFRPAYQPAPLIHFATLFLREAEHGVPVSAWVKT